MAAPHQASLTGVNRNTDGSLYNCRQWHRNPRGDRPNNSRIPPLGNNNNARSPTTSSSASSLLLFAKLLLLSLLSSCWFVPMVEGFLPNRISYEDALSDDDLTHQEITEIGVTRAVARYLGHTVLPDIDTLDPRSWFEENFQEIVNPDNFWEAVEDIVKHRAHYNRRWRSDASKNMNGERIAEGSLEIMMLKGTLIASLKYASIYSSMRLYIAQALHIVQMFYSNTNWVEMNGNAINNDLGIEGRELLVADQYQATCRNCTTQECRDNIIISNILTSGFRSGQDTRKPRWDRPVYWRGQKINVKRKPDEGKCSHGGINDKSRLETASGGINKDSSNPSFSPHHYLHRQATEAAIKATDNFFTDPDHGIFKQMKDDEIQGLFNIRLTRASLVFVIDITDSMRQEIDAVKQKTIEIVTKTKDTRNAPSSFILATFSDPERMTQVRQTTKADEMIEWLRDIRVASGGDCEEYALSGLEQALERATPKSHVYLFTDAPPKEPAKYETVLTRAMEKQIRITPILSGGCGMRSRRRGKRDADNKSKADTWYKLFAQLAEKTGSQVYATTEDQLQDTLAVLEENLVEYPVEVMRTTLSQTNRTSMDIYVDETLWDLRITINTEGSKGAFKFISPNGTSHMESSDVYSKQLTDNMILIKVEKPEQGKWQLVRVSNTKRPKLWTVTVKAQSHVDFSVNLYENEDGMKFEISGRPVSGANVSVELRVPKVKLVKDIETMVLYDIYGVPIREAKLKQRNKRRRQNFRTKLVVPAKPFYIGIIGTDKNGEQFTRLRFTPYHPSSMKLQVSPIPAISHPRMRLKVKYFISNEGAKTESFTVTSSEALHYTVRNNRQRHVLTPGQNFTGHFEVELRDKIGIAVVITITAAIDGTNSQSATQYDSVETMILEKKQAVTTPIPRVPPMCNYMMNATTVSNCIESFNNQACCRHRWSATINAESGSENAPIISVISSRDSLIISEHNMSEGVIIYTAEVSNECCVGMDVIYIKDASNLIGVCYLSSLPGFVEINSNCLKEQQKQEQEKIKVEKERIQVNDEREQQEQQSVKYEEEKEEQQQQTGGGGGGGIEADRETEAEEEEIQNVQNTNSVPRLRFSAFVITLCGLLASTLYYL